MDLIKWSEEYSVGIDEIDNQHKALVIMINELFNLISQGKSKSKLEEIFNHLTDYTKKHFTAEEKMMTNFAYPQYNEHIEEHKKFIAKLDTFRLDLNNGKITLSLELLNFLKDWLLNHILISDKKYNPYI
ncbi:bacteriohemerythrin [Bacteroidota bacterium]